MEGHLRVEPELERILDRCPVEYELVPKREHLFAKFPNGRLVLVGNCGKTPPSRTISNAKANLKRAIKEVLSGARFVGRR